MANNASGANVRAKNPIFLHADPALAPRKLLKMQAQYLIAPVADPEALAQDIGCFSHSAAASLQFLIDAYSSFDNGEHPEPIDTVNILFGLQYTIRMISGMAGALEGMGMRARLREANA